MIRYEVRLTVASGVAVAYRDWLGDHVREILALPGFVRAEVFTEPRDDGQVGYCVHYQLRDMAALTDYLRDHAPRLRADGLARFPGQFTAERRILTLDAAFSA